MNRDDLQLTPNAEPERYELFEEPHYQFDLDRRDFLRVLGGGILVCLAVGDAVAQRPAFMIR